MDSFSAFRKKREELQGVNNRDAQRERENQWAITWVNMLAVDGQCRTAARLESQAPTDYLFSS